MTLLVLSKEIVKKEVHKGNDNEHLIQGMTKI
jgi:hypothetical protein